MANVKHTTNNGEILTTNCKRVATALKRFAEFLGNYDICYNDMLNNIKSANDNNTTTFTDDSYNTITMTLTVNDSNDIYTLTIKHTHNTPRTILCICNQDGNIKDFTDTKNTESDTNTNKTPAELKAEINKKYGVNAVYYDTDSVLCDTEKQNVCIHHDKATDNTTWHIKAYYDGEELTVPYSEYKCREHAVEYIHALYISRVVPYETLFVIYYGKHVETITIETVLVIPELLQCNIEYINVGLKCDVYKDVRNGIERICDLIDDNHLFTIGFVSGDKTRYYTITKSNFKGYYNFKIGNNNLIQKPSEIARYLYYHTFTNKVTYKIWKLI